MRTNKIGRERDSLLKYSKRNLQLRNETELERNEILRDGVDRKRGSKKSRLGQNKKSEIGTERDCEKTRQGQKWISRDQDSESTIDKK